MDMYSSKNETSIYLNKFILFYVFLLNNVSLTNKIPKAHFNKCKNKWKNKNKKWFTESTE